MPPYSSSPLERVLVKNILKKLNAEYGGFWFKVHGGPYQRRGLPDIIGCYKGRFIGFEVKRPGRQLTAIQAQTLAEIASTGGVVSAISAFEDARKILDALA